MKRRSDLSKLLFGVLSALLSWAVIHQFDRVEKIESRLNEADQRIAALRYAVFGVAVDSDRIRRATPNLLPEHEKYTIWSEPLLVPPASILKGKR